MKPERWQQLDKLFHAALERDPEERSAFLDEACAGDQQLRKEVEALIGTHREAGSFIEKPALAVEARSLADEQSDSGAGSMVGKTIGHYEINALLGEGGMGAVYLAKDTKLGRKVALKLLPSYFTSNAERLRRFEQEACAASSLNHPNILTIYEIGEAEGVHYIATEYIKGETLRERMTGAPMKFGDVLDVAAQAASALAAAHEAWIIHRDIKPENVMVRRDGIAKVLDFGLAKMTEEQPPDSEATTRALIKTEPGRVMGTVTYMSPEQTRGEPLDIRSDIFSLGVVLYEAATGRLPFNGPSLLSIMHQIAAVDPPPPSAIKRDLPREFDIIIERALAKDKERRYSSAAELADVLRELKGSSMQSLSGFTATAETAPSEGEPEVFVGREREMKRLSEFLRQGIEGSGRVVFITGEPGIGKTALTDEFLCRSRPKYPGLLFARGRCVEQYGTGEAYLPFLDATAALLAGPRRERIAATLRTFAPTWCLQFPAAFASRGALDELQRETIGATKERMLREMGDALGALAANSPVVLLLEDLHWADASSIDLLRHLCQRIRSQRLLLVGTFRPEDVESSNHPLQTCKLEMQAHKLCEEIALGSLTQEQIADYLDASFAPNDFPPELSSLIQRKTEGHPLFVTSLVQFLAERGDIARVNDHWSLVHLLSKMDIEAPESVRSMIRKKLEALEENDRHALQFASVEGEEFLSTVCAKLLGVDDLGLEERLDRLDKVYRLVETRGEEELPDGTLATRYRFAHALYQNLLYEELISKRRVLLHRQAGEQLLRHYGEEAPRIASQLAMHFERGRDFSRAIEYLTYAGDNATKVFANDEAEKHYGRALGLVEKLPAEEQTERYIALYQKRGTANRDLGRFDQAAEDFTEMLERARAMGSPALESAALNELANALFNSHRMAEMLERTDEALRVAEALGSEALRIETMMLIALKHMCYGELTEAKLLFDEAIRVARAINHKPVLANALIRRGFVHFFQSEYDRAAEMFIESHDLALELRDGFILLSSLFGVGVARGDMGRMSEALGTLHEAMEMARRNGDHYTLSKLPNCIGWIYREMENFDEARKYDRSGSNLAHENRVNEAEANSLINLGYDYTHEGESEKPLAAFREVEAIFARDDWMRWRYNIRLQAGQAEYWLAQSKPEQVEQYAQRLLETATHYEAHKYVAVAHKLLAEVAVARGDLAGADAELKAALAELGSYPVPIVAWKVYAALGRLHSRSGNDKAAHTAFNQAAAVTRQIAANVDDDKLRDTFLSSPAVREVLDGSSGPRSETST